MREDTQTTFEPRAMKRGDLAVTVTPGLRKFPAAEREAMLAAAQACETRLHPWAPAVRRRVKHGAIGAALGVSLLALLLTPLRPVALLFVVPLAALWGAGMAWWRPPPLASGFLLLGLGAGLTALGGHAPLPASSLFLVRVSALMIWFCVGFALGVSRELARADGV